MILVPSSPGISYFVQQNISVHKVSFKWVLAAAHKQAFGPTFRARAQKLHTHS